MRRLVLILLVACSRSASPVAHTLFVAADWNSSVRLGQPACSQRVVIGEVIGRLTLEEKR